MVACVRSAAAEGRTTNDVRTFGTTTRALLELGDWLAASGVTAVAMESTGVYSEAGLEVSSRGGRRPTASRSA